MSKPPLKFGLNSSGLKSNKLGGGLGGKQRAAEEAAQAALAVDPTVFDYDAAFDELKHIDLQKRLQRDGGNTDSARKQARYVDKLLAAAEKRKIDLERAEERRIQRERELEGEQFGDKEMFVTDAYLRRKEELRLLEEEEKRREEAEVQGRDMTAFYRNMLDRQEIEASAAISLSTKPKADDSQEARQLHKMLEEQEALEKEEAARRKEAMQSGRIAINDSEEIVDKRQLLAGGLNVTAKGLRQQQREREELEREAMRLREKRRRDEAEAEAAQLAEEQRQRAQRAREQASRNAEQLRIQHEQKLANDAKQAELERYRRTEA
eukprot:jgi/Hompol1/5699/HPOL_001947-RA